MLRALVLPRRGFFSCVVAMPQYLEFASSQWNRSTTDDVFGADLGASPVAVRNPGPEKVMKPRMISLRRGFFISPVATPGVNQLIVGSTSSSLSSLRRPAAASSAASIRAA